MTMTQSKGDLKTQLMGLDAQVEQSEKDA